MLVFMEKRSHPSGKPPRPLEDEMRQHQRCGGRGRKLLKVFCAGNDTGSLKWSVVFVFPSR